MAVVEDLDVCGSGEEREKGRERVGGIDSKRERERGGVE